MTSDHCWALRWCFHGTFCCDPRVLLLYGNGQEAMNLHVKLGCFCLLCASLYINCLNFFWHFVAQPPSLFRSFYSFLQPVFIFTLPNNFLISQFSHCTIWSLFWVIYEHTEWHNFQPSSLWNSSGNDSPLQELNVCPYPAFPTWQPVLYSI